MAPGHTDTPHPPQHIFGGLERSVERTLGADMTLIYGLAAPIFMIIGLIILLGLSPATWLVVAIMLVELACLGVVLIGLFGLMSDNDDDDESPA